MDLTSESSETSALELNLLDKSTTGIINAASIDSITGLLADMLKAYGSNGITGLGNEAIVISENSVSVTDLNTLDLLTSGTIDASNVENITGSIASLNIAFSSQGIINLGTNISVTDKVTTTTDINLLDNLSTGIIDASSIEILTGSSASVNSIYDSEVSTEDNLLME